MTARRKKKLFIDKIILNFLIQERICMKFWLWCLRNKSGYCYFLWIYYGLRNFIYFIFACCILLTRVSFVRECAPPNNATLLHANGDVFMLGIVYWDASILGLPLKLLAYVGRHFMFIWYHFAVDFFLPFSLCNEKKIIDIFMDLSLYKIIIQ